MLTVPVGFMCLSGTHTCMSSHADVYVNMCVLMRTILYIVGQVPWRFFQDSVPHWPGIGQVG